jgi:hypothetical protein
MFGTLALTLLCIVALASALGFFIRAAKHFGTQRRQNDEIIALLKEIRGRADKAPGSS